jgi:hypothetical protein
VRNALVKEAIDFSEAAQELAPAGVVAPVAAPATPSAQRRVPATRVLTTSTEPEPPRAKRRVLDVSLVVAALVAVAYHGWRFYEGQLYVLPPPTVAGSPAHAVGSATTAGAKFLTSKDGNPFTDAEIETFRQSEELQGRKVQLLTPSSMVSLPAGASQLPVPPRTPGPPAGAAPTSPPPTPGAAP